MRKGTKKKIRVFLFVLIVVGLCGFLAYRKLFAEKVHLKGKNYTYIFISRDNDFEDVMETIGSAEIVDNMQTFRWLAQKMKLDKEIHPGKYRITNGMNMRQIINLIRYGKEEKVKLTYNSQIHDLDEFVKYTDDKLALTEEELTDMVTDEAFLSDHFRLDPDNCFAMVVPGTFEISWAVTRDEFTEKLKERYFKVWNMARTVQAEKLGFTIPEIVTIASIVQAESAIESEREKIAGVYINRLKKNMPLQADPTLKFANKNYYAARVLDVDKRINSPYNTYKYKGLPPGPIALVSTNAIDATLNYSRHNFIYFCAKPQLNGFSDFSSTYEQHRKYASAYRKALDKIGISR